MESCSGKRKIHVMLNLSPNISIAVEQIHIFKMDVIIQLTYSCLASKNVDDSGSIEYYQGHSTSNKIPGPPPCATIKAYTYS